VDDEKKMAARQVGRIGGKAETVLAMVATAAGTFAPFLAMGSDLAKLGAIVLGAAMLVLSLAVVGRGRGKHAYVTVQKRSVAVGDRVIPRDRVRGAWLILDPRAGHLIEVHLTSGERVRGMVADPKHGAEALQALGVGRAELAYRARLGEVGLWPLGALLFFLPVMCIFGIAAMRLTRGEGILWAPFAAIAMMLIIQARRANEIVLGSDGITLIETGGGKFYSWREIRAVNWSPEGIRIETARDRVRVALTPEGAAWVRQAADLARAMRVEHPRDALLDRAGRSFAEWRAAIGQLARGEYRGTAFTVDDARRMLHDPEAPDDRKIAAALLLREMGDAEVGPRVRVAAEAAPQIRVALEAVADGDEEELARRLR
jgi:hypothetical protein